MLDCVLPTDVQCPQYVEILRWVLRWVTQFWHYFEADKKLHGVQNHFVPSSRFIAHLKTEVISRQFVLYLIRRYYFDLDIGTSARTITNALITVQYNMYS
jgi:hypothetical protein